MEKWIWLLIFIVGALITLYILLFVVVISFSLLFKRKIAKRVVAINLLLTQRHDVLLLIDKLFLSNGVPVQSYVTGYIRDSINYSTKELSKDERDNLINNLNKATQAFMYLADQHEEIKNNVEFAEYCKTINELDTNYRQNIAIYNSDITGYNYWVCFVGYKWLLKMFGLKKKEIII